MEITALSGTVTFWGADCSQMRQMSQTKMKQHIIVIYKTETEKVRKHVSKRHFPGGKEQGHKQMETGSHSPKAGNCGRSAPDALRGRRRCPRPRASLWGDGGQAGRRCPHSSRQGRELTSSRSTSTKSCRKEGQRSF